jgi:hypothetical protein
MPNDAPLPPQVAAAEISLDRINLCPQTAISRGTAGGRPRPDAGAKEAKRYAAGYLMRQRCRKTPGDFATGRAEEASSSLN